MATDAIAIGVHDSLASLRDGGADGGAGMSEWCAAYAASGRRYRRTRRRLLQDADDLKWVIARLGDILETLPRSKEAARAVP